MAEDESGILRILAFFLPGDFSIALQLTTRPFGMSPDIRAVMGSRIKELDEEGYRRCQRKHEESERQFAARVFKIKPNEVDKHPIASALLQEILERTKLLEPVGR